MTCRFVVNGLAAAFRANSRWLGMARGLVIYAFLMGAVAIIGIPSVKAENSDITLRRSLERTDYTDSEILDGFFKIAFGAELQLGQHVERIRKFDEPVRVLVIDHSHPKKDLAAVVSDIGARVNHLDIALTNDARTANVIVTLVRARDFKPTVRRIFGTEKATQIEQTLTPECLSGFGKDQYYRIRHAEVILPVDAGEFTFLDCAYEELLQALGPINDDSSVPWTMFNDDVQMGFFDTYDQYLLNILYHPRIRPGMTKEEVRNTLPEVLPAVRSWVASTNPSRIERTNGVSGIRLDKRCSCLVASSGISPQ
jgi:Protein of unknown function (DUF2927)